MRVQIETIYLPTYIIIYYIIKVINFDEYSMILNTDLFFTPCQGKGIQPTELFWH